jgi:hypothetical protein
MNLGSAPEFHHQQLELFLYSFDQTGKTITEWDFVPGWEPPLAMVSQPGTCIRD